MGFNALTVAKFVVSGVVGIGTGKIVGKVIKTHVTPETLIDKVTVTAAAWVIGAIATERTKTYTNDMIDDVVQQGSRVVNDVKLSGKLGRINRQQSSFEEEGLDRTEFERNPNNGRWQKIKTFVAETVESDAVKTATDN